MLLPRRLQMMSSLDLPARRVLVVHLGGMTAGMLCWLAAVRLAQQVAPTHFSSLIMLDTSRVQVRHVNVTILVFHGRSIV